MHLAVGMIGGSEAASEPTDEADRGRHPGFERHEGVAGGPCSLSLTFVSEGVEKQMSRLTWSDLLIEDITPDQFQAWLEPWAGVVVGRVGPMFLNKFGTIFLRRPAGPIEMLDVFTGQVHKMADTHEDFVRDVNETWWQEVYLLSEVVWQLHEAGKVPGPGQCYALCPHPALGGRNPANGEAIDPRFVMVMDVRIWQSLCAQFLGVGAIGRTLH
jgi:hypothetical protein